MTSCNFSGEKDVADAKQPTNQTSMGQHEAAIDALLAKMTLTEKVGQLNMYNAGEFTGPTPKGDDGQQRRANIMSGRVGGMLNVLTPEKTHEAQRLAVENSRLGIPLIFGYDVIHGYKTMFPIPLAQAASWDTAAARQGCAVAAREAAADGIQWAFAPMIDISRDARWGRIMESAGEDPYLTSVMARAWIEGYQGQSLADPHTIAACAKHFAGYGFAEAGRDYNTVDISEHTLHNVVLPPFRAAVEAGVATLMNGFNELGGMPVTGDRYLQREILKGDWAFQGFVVSDWASIGEMKSHGVAEDDRQAAKLAIIAGSDMDMEARAYERYLEELIESGEVNEALLDDAVRRILRIKFELGLFDDPYRYGDPEKAKTAMLTPENLAAARDAARKSAVLLKNDPQLLPLKKEGQRIGIIGDLAQHKDIPLGSWRAQAVQGSAVSLLEGMKAAVGDQNLRFAKGYTLTKGRRTFVHELTLVEGDQSGFAEAIAVAKSSDVVVMAMGEDCFQTGEGRSQVDVQLKGDQNELLREVLKVNPNVVVVLMTGRPVAIPEIAENVPAILQLWYGGSSAGHAAADLLFGDYNPSGKLPVSFPRHTGQEPLYYNHKNTGRPVTNEWDAGLVFWSHYTDEQNSPLFPFGYGLSYTTFEYKNLSLSTEQISQGGSLTVTLTIANTGDRAGKATPQLYIRDLVASVTRPVRELKGYQQVALAPGESKEVTFELTTKDLEFWRKGSGWISEPGKFQLWVGPNSAEGLSTYFELQ